MLCVCLGELPIQNGSMDFVPSSQLPGLQYVEHVDKRSSASAAGLCAGDFILEVILSVVWHCLVLGCVLVTSFWR